MRIGDALVLMASVHSLYCYGLVILGIVRQSGVEVAGLIIMEVFLLLMLGGWLLNGDMAPALVTFVVVAANVVLVRRVWWEHLTRTTP